MLWVQACREGFREVSRFLILKYRVSFGAATGAPKSARRWVRESIAKVRFFLAKMAISGGRI